MGTGSGDGRRLVLRRRRHLRRGAVLLARFGDGRRTDACVVGSGEPEEIATGYKAHYEAERGWRDLKSTIDMRPVFHRREGRIRAHVQLCWLALLLARVAQLGAGDTWADLRNELERLHLVT